jgi:predicted RecA/RadA family phage recombinase
MTARNSRTRKPRVLKAEVIDGEAVVVGELPVAEDTTEAGKQIAVFVSNEQAKEEAEQIAQGKKPKREFVFTPYQGHYLVNAMLAKAGVVDEYGVVKTINSPMIYIYLGKGKFTATIASDGSGRKQLDHESFIAWAEEYVERAKKLQDARNAKSLKKTA